MDNNSEKNNQNHIHSSESANNEEMKPNSGVLASDHKEVTNHGDETAVHINMPNDVNVFSDCDSQLDSFKDHEAALTQIGNQLRDKKNQKDIKGFIQAQNDANQALAENKIILNHRFVLQSILGSGGMGSVYKAQDLRKVEAVDSNPYVAVKILNSDFRNHPDAFVSLQREASRSHILSHPNIVTVHDFDRDGNTIFMTMELLDGEDLDALLKRHKGIGLPKELVFKILQDFCQALIFAHEKGIIHSDLKPANIFVSQQQAKILDFGIARLAAESQYQDHFDAGSIGALTPSYASLEMINHQPPDESDDVYAAAIIAYELLTGTHPYQRKTAKTAKALNLKPKRIKGLSYRQWKALSSALQLERSERTTTVREFVESLTVVPGFPWFKLVSAVSLVALCWVAYSKFFIPDELTVFIEETLNKAKVCQQQQDFACEINSAKAVLRIAPQNIEVQAILSVAEKNYTNQQQQINIQNGISLAEKCFAQNDYTCVLSQTDLVLEVDPNHEQALLLSEKVQMAITVERLKTDEKNKDFTNHMLLATQCFDAQDYLCAIESSKLALTNKADDPTAKSIYESSNYALRQQQENLKKANKILQDGLRCFKKLDYSCAIAKSESALEFVPNHKKALKLKRDAIKSMANVKKTIEIQ